MIAPFLYVYFMSGRKKNVTKMRERVYNNKRRGIRLSPYRRKIMPSSYTHQIIAEEIAGSLPENVKSRIPFAPEYFLGAQGGDVFYFYNIAGGQKNIGKYFHRRNTYGIFSSFLESARTDGAHAVSYAAGYITHYAADTVFHPYVYWLCKRQKETTGRKRDNFHGISESDLDTYFVQKYKRMPVNEYGLPLRTEDLALAEIYPLLSRAVACGSGEKALQERGLRRAVKRFFSFQNFFSDRHFRRRKALYGAEKLFHAPHCFSGLYRREKYDGTCLNAERGEWYYPADPNVTSRESADELFGRSVREGVRLICAFFIALDGGAPLGEEDFSKHFLTGLAHSESLPFDEKGEPRAERES